ncbi:hypothetical protein ACLGI4_27800 [Streptomyces sp. HMX112]|uniref:hypothetical protein n=1 Tax=Streptomyces sp. HMX112 TaxID=3390850 RepID=UPI003A7F93A4
MRILGPGRVIATVCSAWAARVPPVVREVQPSPSLDDVTRRLRLRARPGLLRPARGLTTA